MSEIHVDRPMEVHLSSTTMISLREKWASAENDGWRSVPTLVTQDKYQHINSR